MGITYNPKVITDGLVFCLDAASKRSYPGTGTTWTDLVGENDGTLTNGPTFSSANGGGIVFDGSDDFVDLGDISPFNISSTDPYSINLWNKSTGGGSDAMFSRMDASNGYIGYDLYHDSPGYVSMHLINSWSSNAIKWYGTINIEDGKWHHIVGTYDGSEVIGGFQVYVDGVADTRSSSLDTFSDGSSINASKSAKIGCRTSGSSTQQEWPGSVANFMFYHRALTADEVLQNYNATRGRFGL